MGQLYGRVARRKGHRRQTNRRHNNRPARRRVATILQTTAEGHGGGKGAKEGKIRKDATRHPQVSIHWGRARGQETGSPVMGQAVRDIRLAGPICRVAKVWRILGRHRRRFPLFVGKLSLLAQLANWLGQFAAVRVSMYRTL